MNIYNVLLRKYDVPYITILLIKVKLLCCPISIFYSAVRHLEDAEKMLRSSKFEY